MLVYGVTGSGKSALAARISERTGIPWHPVDDLTWEPGWVQVSTEEQRRRFAEICAGDTWVLDTAYSTWIDIALPRAELVVGLDLPRHVSLLRLVRRSVMRVRTGVPVCNGNRETWRRLVSRDSIVLWHFRSFASKRRRFRDWEGDPRFVRLTSARAVEDWLSGEL